MPLRAKHQNETARRRQRPAGTRGGPTHYGHSPAREENLFPKPWWARHRIESPRGRASGTGRAGGQAPTKGMKQLRVSLVTLQTIRLNYIWLMCVLLVPQHLNGTRIRKLNLVLLQIYYYHSISMAQIL
jgi:hypothetical protein